MKETAVEKVKGRQSMAAAEGILNAAMLHMLRGEKKI
jgi:hypothetical protein